MEEAVELGPSSWTSWPPELSHMIATLRDGPNCVLLQVHETEQDRCSWKCHVPSPSSWPLSLGPSSRFGTSVSFWAASFGAAFPSTSVLSSCVCSTVSPTCSIQTSNLQHHESHHAPALFIGSALLFGSSPVAAPLALLLVFLYFMDNKTKHRNSL